MLGNKYKGQIDLALDKNEIFNTWTADRKSCKRNLKLQTNFNSHNIVVQDGALFGTPLPGGGIIYPFSEIPSRAGFSKKIGSTKIITISKVNKLEVNWGIQNYSMRDKDGNPYKVGANGTFWVQVDGAQANSAMQFYLNLLMGESNMTHEGLRDRLLKAFKLKIGKEIQAYLQEAKYSFADIEKFDITPDQALDISENVYEKIKDIFTEDGLIFEETHTKGALVSGVVVRAFN